MCFICQKSTKEIGRIKSTLIRCLKVNVILSCIDFPKYLKEKGQFA